MADGGKVLAIAKREKKFAPMEELDQAEITTSEGLVGDSRGGAKNAAQAGRQIVVVAAESWSEACHALDAEVPWTFRRGNLLIQGLALAESTGRRLAVGEVELEVTCEIDPCPRMDAQHQGLTEALRPNWRGGVGCRVLKGGTVRLGDTAHWLP